jgi:hypothetical protein
LNNKDVCRCFAKAWKSALRYSRYYPEWFSKDGRKLISRPTWELEESLYFHIPMIRLSYPIENDVFMLSIPMEKIAENLRKKLKDWESDCLTNGIKLIEENGRFNEVQIKDGRLCIDVILSKNVCFTYPLALLMMKREDVARDLTRIIPSPTLDVEWKSLKESAKLLIQRIYFKQVSTLLVSEKTGVVQVPNGIKSVREAEDFLRQSSLQNDQ